MTQFPPPRKLSSPEFQKLRVEATRRPLTLEEVASFVLSSRASFLALPKVKEKKKKKPPASPTNQTEIDFF